MTVRAVKHQPSRHVTPPEDERASVSTACQRFSSGSTSACRRRRGRDIATGTRRRISADAA